MEDKMSKTKGWLCNEISFLLGLVFIKNIKIYLNIVFSRKAMVDFISLSFVIKTS